MPDWTEAGQRWRLLVPAGALVVDAGTIDADRSAADLPSGATVVLVGARRQVRAHVRAAGLTVDTEYLALPSLAATVVLTPAAALGWTSRAVLTVPPGVTRLHRPYSLAIGAVRVVPRLLRLLARDRVVVGRRP